MKKTIVAAAVAAVVSAPAFADVSVSGAVQVEAGEFANVSKTVTKSDVFFKGSEDLGNGLKAGFVIQRTADDESAPSTGSDRYITLSNGMMTGKMGYFEQYIEGTIGASAANEPGHDTSNEVDDGESGAQNGLALEIAPMAGVTAGIQSGDTSTTVYASYSNAGLTVRAANESGNGSRDVDAFSVEYKIDGLTGRFVTIDDGNGASGDWAGVDYTMGANNIAFSQATSGAEDGDQTVSIKHSLSKRTSVYLVHDTDDSDTTGNSDNTIVGIKHSF